MKSTNKSILKYEKIFDDDSILPSVIHPKSDPTRGQVQLCHNLIANLFEKGNSPCKQELSEIKNLRQVLDHYLTGISNITSPYEMFTIEILPPQTNQAPHRIQTDDMI